VFVRPSIKQRPGDKDAKPYQILTTDSRSIVVYNLKSGTPYRVDVVAVNKWVTKRRVRMQPNMKQIWRTAPLRSLSSHLCLCALRGSFDCRAHL
jgi:hypothetical protein